MQSPNDAKHTSNRAHKIAESVSRIIAGIADEETSNGVDAMLMHITIAAIVSAHATAFAEEIMDERATRANLPPAKPSPTELFNEIRQACLKNIQERLLKASTQEQGPGNSHLGFALGGPKGRGQALPLAPSHTKPPPEEPTPRVRTTTGRPPQ